MRYSPGDIESKWQKRWLKAKTYEPNFLGARKPFYNLMMFPYPSAEGLHVGNMYAFVGADIHGRFQRMQGRDVFEPIGLDGFGIHSENYALSIGKHPANQAKISEERFYGQLKMIGNGFAWKEKLETYDPDYYKWTQWIFIQMFRRGLAYRKKAVVNWCPSCQTVLADEQVVNGACERCNSKVIKKDLEQWFFKITAYAERLLKNLEKIDWSEKIKVAQRNWIGRSEGSLIKFPIVIASEAKQSRRDRHGLRPRDDGDIEVFTTRPDTLFGATFLAISPGLAQRWLDVGWRAGARVKAYIKRSLAAQAKRGGEPAAKTGVFSGVWARNPASGKKIPVWVADYVLGSVGTGALFGDAHDERDVAFAQKYRIPLKPTLRTGDRARDARIKRLQECFTGDGILFDSGKFSGLRSAEARVAITAWLTKRGQGRPMIQYRLRDWLISRQRYWGPPIPMIYCAACAKAGRGERKEMPGWYVVPEKDLPVKLPYIKNFRPTGTDKSPLALVEKFYKIRCPKCKSWARRETDVSDTFLDSAWYYLRYPFVRYAEHPWDPAVTRKWFPVDMYIGGAEHAVLHLLYVRFLAMAFSDWRLTYFEEPFKKFRAHGLLIKDGAKMSKSRGNVVNPDEYIRAYGADALRMYLMFLGPFEQGGDFRDTGIRGITRFLERVWRFTHSVILSEAKNPARSFGLRPQDDIMRKTHQTIKKVSEDIEGLQYNTAISALMILLNAFEAHERTVTREHLLVFLRLLAPFAPHVTEELWCELGEKFSIHKSRWPEADQRFLKAERAMVVVQVNGRVRDQVEVEAGMAEAKVKELVLAREKVRQWIGAKPVRKLIYVPGRVVNIVVEAIANANHRAK